MTISIYDVAKAPMGWAVYCDGVKLGGVFGSKAAAFEAATVAASFAVSKAAPVCRSTYRTRRDLTRYRAIGSRQSKAIKQASGCERVRGSVDLISRRRNRFMGIR